MVGDAQRYPAIDSSVLQSVVEMIGPDEPSVILDLIDTYMQDSQNQVDELQRALATSDYKTLHRMAHSMKSSSATFGAMILSKLCEALEHSAKDNCANGNCANELDDLCVEHARVIEALHHERLRFQE
jgi:HPt (histidine-containing phosphotransfer) domain-containing protein